MPRSPKRRSKSRSSSKRLSRLRKSRSRSTTQTHSEMELENLYVWHDQGISLKNFFLGNSMERMTKQINSKIRQGWHLVSGPTFFNSYTGGKVSKYEGAGYEAIVGRYIQ